MNCHGLTEDEDANALSDAVLPMGHGCLRLRFRLVVLFFDVTLGGCC